MNMNGIGSNRIGFTGAPVVRTKVEEKASSEQDNIASSTKPNQDTFEKTEPDLSGIYGKPSKNKLNNEQVQALQDAETARQENFVQMLKSMVVKQGQASNLTLFGMKLFVTPEQSAKAAASIAEGGEYSVDAVAGRIMDMAKALSGGDPSKIEKLRAAVEKGFKAAGSAFGGKLPSISEETHKEVMNRFDKWAEEANKGTSTEK